MKDDLPDRFRLPSRTTLLFGDAVRSILAAFGCLVFAAFDIASREYVVGPLLLLLGAALFVLSLRPTWVTAGADGLLVRWIGRGRFVSYESMSTVEEHTKYKMASGVFKPPQEASRGVRFSSSTGAETYLVCDATTARDLKAAVNWRRGAFRKGARLDELASLQRGRRSTEEWLGSLRRLCDGTSYREGAVRPETLWRIVESPHAPAEQRAAAALALRTHAPTEAAPRLRVAIDTCASPRLRVALEAIEANDEAAIGEHLRRLARG